MRKAVLLCVLMLAGCVGPTAPANVAEGTPAATETDASTWTPFFLESPSALRGAAPVSEGTGLDLLPHDAAIAAYWNEDFATRHWTELQIRHITQFKESPPRAARSLALVHAAMYDAVIASADEREAFDVAGYPSDRVAVAWAAATVLAELYPQQGAKWFEDRAHEVEMARTGIDSNAGINEGKRLGLAVAERALAHARSDGADLRWDGIRPAADPCTWVPTPPLFIQTPLEPRWGEVAPFLMANGSQFRPPPPPDCTGEEGITEYRMTWQISRAPDARQAEIARYWADGPDASGPPAHGNRLALDLADRYDLDTAQAARVFAYVNAAMADAGISVWDAKFTYWSVRPVTVIKRTLDANFTTLVVTPPFPGYVSGHSGFTGASTRVLGHFFPEDRLYLRALGTETANARMYGGIHTPSDDEIGMAMGWKVADLAIARATADGGWAGTVERFAAEALQRPPESSRWAFLAENSLGPTEGGY